MSSLQEKATTSVLESASMSENIVNGVNVAALSQIAGNVKENPAVAKFRFEVKNGWLGGAHSRSIVNQFYRAGQNVERSQSFWLHSDEPPMLLGGDLGPNPGEYLLHALAACVTSAMVFHAAARGIAIEEVESMVEGDVDLRGFMGLDKNVRNGFQNIRMNFAIRAEMGDQELQELAMLGPAFSPVFDTLTRGVPITVQAHRMNKG